MLVALDAIRSGAKVQDAHSAVIFDLDGLLVDSEPLYMRAWQEAALALGFQLTNDRYYSLIGLPEAECESAIVDFFGAGFPLSVFRDRWKALWFELLRSGELRPKAGARQLVQALDVAGIPMAIATSSTRHYAMLSIRSVELDSYFRHLVVVEDVAHGKPAPDLFLLAASRLGVPPSRCLVLEDSATGVEAGLAAGMSVIVVPDLCEPPDECVARAFMVAANLDDARPHVLRAVRAIQPGVEPDVK